MFGFNPLPARRPGATFAINFNNLPFSVSIPSQPEGRELQKLCIGGEAVELFQSPPSPKAGSYLRNPAILHPYRRFNPLPARRPGATAAIAASSVWVSFQSPPSPKAGSYQSREVGTRFRLGFNPLPARRPGATRSKWHGYTPQICFNPLPARRPGATQTDTRTLTMVEFQSPPSPKAGSYRCALPDPAHACSFNPLPARRPGATDFERFCVYHQSVSIPSQPEGRELLFAIF